MARLYRLEAENTLYHLTNRGDGRKKIYKSENDYEKFLEYVLQAKKRYKFRLYAYVLMRNHYHLLVETLHANSRCPHDIIGRSKKVEKRREEAPIWGAQMEGKDEREVEDLRGRNRRDRVRKIAIYLMRELTGLTNRDIGTVFNMKHSAVSKAALGLEREMAEDAGLKREVARLVSNFEA